MDPTYPPSPSATPSVPGGGTALTGWAAEFGLTAVDLAYIAGFLLLIGGLLVGLSYCRYVNFRDGK